MKINRLVSLSGLFAAALLVAATSAQAATNGFLVPAFRGSANSEAGYWEAFATAVGAPGNLADKPGATTGAVLTQLSPNGFLTGSGNIYNFTDASSFVLADTTPFTLSTVVLQTRTIGSELDYTSVLLNYTDASGAHSLAPLFRHETDRTLGNGYNVSSLWQWDVTGLGVSSYNLSFLASGSSMSFDSLTLDTSNQFAVVPEPSAFALCGLSVLLFGKRVLRRHA